MRIFDLKGRLIRVVKDQDLVAARGEIVWDGRNKEGKIISVGLYIILFEATGLENEKVYSKTKTVTIAK
jgi:flagellar hook assembly protein FlgD